MIEDRIKLKEAIEKKFMNWRILSDHIGVSPQYLNRVMSGENPLTDSLKYKLNKWLNEG